MPHDDQIAALITAMRRLPSDQRGELRLALDRLAAEAPSGPTATRAGALIGRLREALDGDEEDEARDRRLVDKLADAGRLRSGFLVRALKEGRLGLFEAALARLGGFEGREVSRAVARQDQPELLALACVTVGIDESAFPTILALVRELSGGRPGDGESAARRAMGAFGPFPADRAASAFRRVMRAV